MNQTSFYQIYLSNDDARKRTTTKVDPFDHFSCNHQDEYYSWEMEEAPLVFDRFGDMDTQKELDSLGIPFIPPVRRVTNDQDEEEDEDDTGYVPDNFEDSLQGIYYDGPELDPYALVGPSLFEEPLPLTNNSTHSETSALQTQFQRKCSLEDVTERTESSYSEISTMEVPHEGRWLYRNPSLNDLEGDFFYREDVKSNESEVLTHCASPKTKRKQRACQSNKRQRKEQQTTFGVALPLTDNSVHSETSAIRKQFEHEFSLKDTTEVMDIVTNTKESSGSSYGEISLEDAWLYQDPSLDEWNQPETVTSQGGQQKEQPTKLPPTSGIVPTNIDVLGGRGGLANNHPGNARDAPYWSKVLELRNEYQALHPRNHVEKVRIATIVMDFVHEKGGRFLKVNTSTKSFYEMSEKDALEKIKQALRDRYEPHSFTA